jgi:serine/threonine-protein kinase
MTTPSLPEKIGRYEIRSEIGSGPMGVVYEAFDPEMQRIVAVKTVAIPTGLMPRDRESFESRFFTEARIAARLSHPGIAIVHDVGRAPETGLLYMVLERLTGSTLAALLQESRLAWRMALHIAAGVADALGHAHGEGVIHGDIKPENVMVLLDGDAKLMDFGIAKIERARIRLTMSGQHFGTPLYMSPEDALGLAVDQRIDLFALGAVLYQSLTGRPAFGADTLGKIVGKVVLEEPAPASTIVSGLPSDTDYVLARALAKDRDHRYHDGREMAAAIMDVLAGQPPRHRAAWAPPPPGAPPQATESQIQGLKKGAFLPPAVQDLAPDEDDPWAFNLHRSVGGTVVSTARHRTLPASPRTSVSEPKAPDPDDTLPPAAPVEPPTLVGIPALGRASSVGTPTLVGIPALGRASSVETPTLVGAPPLALPTAARSSASAPTRTSPPQPKPLKRDLTTVALAVAVLVAAVGIGALAVALVKPGLFNFHRRTASPTASPVTPSAIPPSLAPPSAIPAPEATAVIQEAAVTPEPSPSPVGEEVVLVPAATPEPTPAPSKKPRRAKLRPVPTPPATAPPRPPPRYARLAFNFEHRLQAGTLRVWVDEELLLDESLDSEKTRKVGEVLEVLPGDHEIRVEVAWDDNVKTKRISGAFEADSTRRLSARVGGLLKKGLSLKWE